MSVELLTEHHLEFLSLKGGCTGLFDSTLVKMPHCWKSHVTAHVLIGRDSYQVIDDLVEQGKAPFSSPFMQGYPIQLIHG